MDAGISANVGDGIVDADNNVAVVGCIVAAAVVADGVDGGGIVADVDVATVIFALEVVGTRSYCLQHWASVCDAVEELVMLGRSLKYHGAVVGGAVEEPACVEGVLVALVMFASKLVSSVVTVGINDDDDDTCVATIVPPVPAVCDVLLLLRRRYSAAMATILQCQQVQHLIGNNLTSMLHIQIINMQQGHAGW